MNATATRNYPATERTIQYIKDLLDERDLTASTKFVDATQAMDEGELRQYMCQLRQRARTMTQEDASRWIDRLKQLPKKHNPAAPHSSADSKFSEDFKALAAKVPAGRYAVTGADGTTDFYRVDKPVGGKWDGYTFVKLQLSDDYQRVSFKSTAAILQKVISAGPREASERYGRELGHCGICGKTLTNNDSIERGIGPVCAGKMGW